MSITLDVSNFLQNENPNEALDGFNAGSGAPHQATRKMQALLHKELEDITELPKDSANIFDEIENFLKLNKFIENSEPSRQPQQNQPEFLEQCTILDQPRNDSTVVPPSLPVSTLQQHPPTSYPSIFISSTNNEFQQQYTLPECLPTTFLDVPDLAHEYSVLDPQLYSVEDGELKPITAPFLVPGIYKKIDNGLQDEGYSGLQPNTAENVFISTNEARGCVLSVTRFHELYICAGPNGAPPDEFLDSNTETLLVEPLEESSKDANKPLPTLSINCGTRVPKQWDALSKLAYDILKLSNRDQIVIDRKRNELVRTNSATRQKTIYRFLSAENFGLKPHQKREDSLPEDNETATQAPVRLRSLFGRPPKRQASDGTLPATSTKKSLKKRKQQQQQSKQQAANVLREQPEPAKTSFSSSEPGLLTRSGRVVRSRVIQRETTEQGNFSGPGADDPAGFMHSFLADLKDRDFRCSRLGAAIPHAAASAQQEHPADVVASEANCLPNSNSTPSKGNAPAAAVCPTCNKIFLGRRLQRHFVQHPDHMQPQLVATSQAAAARTKATPSPQPTCQQQSNEQSNCIDLTLFRFLVAKLQRAPLSEDQRADLFLNEINDLVAQLQLRSSRLIRNTSGLHFVSARCSRVLGIPEGHYALDMTAIGNEAPPPPPNEPPESSSASCILNFEHLSSSALPAPSANARSLEYTALSMSLDDTLTDEAAQKLNLSAGGKLLPPSEESLLRTVGDLVHDGLQKLQQQTAAEGMFHAPASKVGIQYDNVSDNAVEAVSMKETTAVQQTTPLLGLSVDFFQFNND